MLTDEFRAQRLEHQWPEDVLQLETSIWHAWNSLYRIHSTSLSHKQASDDPADDLANPTVDPPRDSAIDLTSTTTIDGGATNDLGLIIEPRPEGGQGRRQQKRKARRQRLAISERPYIPGHDCLCLYCPRQCNKSGLIHHM
jgi:hypothetical protein